MPRYCFFGGISVIGGAVMFICQAVASLMASKELIWRDFSIRDAMGARYLGWIDDVSWQTCQVALKSIVSLPFYGCLIAIGIAILITGGIRQR